MKSPAFPRSIALLAVALLPLLCSRGAGRWPTVVGASSRAHDFDRIETGTTAVPAKPPSPSGTVAPRSSAPRGGAVAAGVGGSAIEAAVGEPSDTTGVLLRRDFDSTSDPAIVDRYLLYLPPGIDEGRWPLVLYLHGQSLRGDDLSLLTRYGLPARLEDDDDFPFVVVAPQLPAGQSWTDTGRLADLVRHVIDRYPVDPTRVYLIGYSMGGGGVWRVAIDHPELFAAVAPAAAWTPEPSALVARALRNLPIRIYHGTADEEAPFSRAEAMVRALKSAGVDVTFSVFPGAEHGDLTDIYKDDDLYAWLLAHRLSRGTG